MRRRIGLSGLATVTVLLVGWTPPLTAQVSDPDPQRFAKDFEDFAKWDAKNSFPEHAVLFVGSSSVNRWNTADAFPRLPVINRGFGGSQASDATYWIQQAVLKYDPSVVVYYEGDNDIAADKKGAQILDDIKEFAHSVLSHDPSAQVIILSIKPSLLRWDRWGDMQAANTMLEEFSKSSPQLHYVDVGSAMLGSDGKPKPELFVQDGLHMTQAGYDIWNRIVGTELAHLSH